jgi:hypothetical protein
MTIWSVEWSPTDDHFIVALCTSEEKAAEIFNAFSTADVGWLYLNEYEADKKQPLELPKQIAERRFD